ncbi:MAG: tRNA preQ1(34) S-adenosylmethionine ribosyltransferase-isomerase QueA [Acidimicrobiia bacterium]
MLMDEFEYALTEDAVAQAPCSPRDAARLLVDNGAGREPSHRHVYDLPELLREGDLLVVNDTRVLPARLRLQRESGGQVEVLLLHKVGSDESTTWEAMVRPSRKLHVGEILRFGHPSNDDLTVEVGERVGDGATRFVTLHALDSQEKALARHGTVPLPPYIHTPLEDPERYQTVYARRPASVAAPTAGLHLTDAVFAGLAAKGIDVARVELIVGLDTFRPVAVDDPADHVIHTEQFRVEPDVLERCRAARRVVAVGTTTVRALESAARGLSGDRTDLFIRRGFDWQVVDVLMTNFHLPRTTLLLLVDAFMGPRWRDLYDTALAEGYRFLSFGDAMLLQRHAG